VSAPFQTLTAGNGQGVSRREKWQKEDARDAQEMVPENPANATTRIPGAEQEGSAEGNRNGCHSDFQKEQDENSDHFLPSRPPCEATEPDPLVLHIVATEINHEQKSDGSQPDSTPVLWTFICPDGLHKRFSRMLDADVLGLVLDLDEALVQSATPDSIAQRLNSVNERLKQHETTPEEVRRLKNQRDWLTIDRQILEEFRQHHTVTFAPNRPPALAEHEPTDDLQYRNVVKVPQRSLRMDGISKVFTRFNHRDQNTSFIVHVRRFMNALRDSVVAPSGPSKPTKDKNASEPPRFETYVCTAAQPDYAMEVTRVIDPTNPCKLFAGEHRSFRVVSITHELKSLPLATMSRVPPQLTVIVDDRTQVWDPHVRDHVLVVPDFQVYDNAEDDDSALWYVATELKKIRKSFLDKLNVDHFYELRRLEHLETISSWPVPPSLSHEVHEANQRLHDAYLQRGGQQQKQRLEDGEQQYHHEDRHNQNAATAGPGSSSVTNTASDEAGAPVAPAQERPRKGKVRAMRNRSNAGQPDDSGHPGAAHNEQVSEQMQLAQLQESEQAQAAGGQTLERLQTPVQERPRKKRRRGAPTGSGSAATEESSREVAQAATSDTVGVADANSSTLKLQQAQHHSKERSDGL
jgi:hypothetical protein